MPHFGHSAVWLASIQDLIVAGSKISKHEKQPHCALASSSTRCLEAWTRAAVYWTTAGEGIVVVVMVYRRAHRRICNVHP